MAKNTQAFFERRSVARIHQSPYSPDLNQCDRWIFKELKTFLSTHKYCSAAQVRESALEWFRALPREKFVAEVDRLYRYCQDVVRCDGENITWK